LAEVVGVEPADLVVRLPELAGLVDVNLAGLLGIRLAELLADAQGLDAGLEHASFAAQIGCAIEAERGGKMQLSLVQHVAVGVIGQIQHRAFPLGLERLAVALEGLEGRREIRECVVVSVVAVGGRPCRLGRCRRRLHVERVEHLGLGGALRLGRAGSTDNLRQGDLLLASLGRGSRCELLEYGSLCNAAGLSVVAVEAAFLFPPPAGVLHGLGEDGGLEGDDELVVGADRLALQACVARRFHVLGDDVLLRGWLWLWLRWLRL
jgi:hypothetical protein